jgi:hypothetical protein
MEVQNMKLLENLSVGSHLRTGRRTDVAKLIVFFRFAIVLSQPIDSTSSLQEIISSYHIYIRVQL